MYTHIYIYICWEKYDNVRKTHVLQLLHKTMQNIFKGVYAVHDYV